MKNRIPLALSALVVVAGTAVALFAQGNDEPDPFDLRRLLIDRVEAAYTAGDTATLMRMAGMEAPPLTGRARSKHLIAEAKALLEQQELYKPPPQREVLRARAALFELIDNSSDDLVYAFYMLALERQELEEEGWELLEELEELAEEILREEAWETRATELTGGRPGF